MGVWDKVSQECIVFVHLLQVKRQIRSLLSLPSQFPISKISERIGRVVPDIKMFAADSAQESCVMVRVRVYFCKRQQQLTLVVQDTSRIHGRDRDVPSLVLLVVPGMAALGPDRAFKILLREGVVVTDDGVFDGNRSGYVSSCLVD